MCSFLAQALVVLLLIGLGVPAEAVPAPVLTDDMYSGTSTIKKTQQQKQPERQKQINTKKKKVVVKKKAPQ